MGRLDHFCCASMFATQSCYSQSRCPQKWSNIAQLGTVIGTGLDFVEIHEGFGRPAYYLTKGQIREFKKYTYGEWIQTFATLTLTKISICLFLMRIPTAKILLRPLQASIFVLILTNIILTVLWIVQCRPIRGAWDPDINATCFGRGQLERVIISQAGQQTLSLPCAVIS